MRAFPSGKGFWQQVLSHLTKKGQFQLLEAPSLKEAGILFVSLSQGVLQWLQKRRPPEWWSIQTIQ